jgi:PPOX class probable F420-dependent enzyme
MAGDASPPPFARERYVNLETFRKDGTGVKTPVWAAPLEGRLVVFTDGRSYKVKRIRRDPRVRVAACDVRGSVRGEWVGGTARILEDPADAERAHSALRGKYGLVLAVIDVFARLFGRMRRRVYLELALPRDVTA